jgi:ribonuclease P/MRP protein subunit POP1
VPKRLRSRAWKEATEDNTPTGKNKSGSGIGKSKSSKKWLRKEGIERSRKKAQYREGKKKAKDLNKVTVTRDDGKEVKGDKKKTAKSELQKTKRKKFAKLAKPPMPASRFRRRQLNKTWLPTHMWHVKRAYMTPPKEPLWRFATPLAPNVKAYRLTHRAASLRGAVAWDMSYMATIGLEGVEASILGMLRGLHFAQEDGNKPWQNQNLAKYWRSGTRAWEGWIYEREGKDPKKLAQVAVIWCAHEDSKSNKRKAFIRVHPSVFLQLWNEIIRAAKVQNPSVVVEDLRFEIGSIEIMGPAAAEALCSILNPSSTTSALENTPSLWPSLASVTDVGMLPANPIISFNCSDPRLRDPPTAAAIAQDVASQTKLIETLAAWPLDSVQMPSAIFERNARLAAQRSLPSQQSINRRKSAATPGQHSAARPTDPHIPMLSYVSSVNKKWTILLPWKCVLPVWRCLMRYPISTGGNPRFGGLKEIRQVNFERSKPTFPFDCPGTDAGWAWELHERIERKNEWARRPKGKRIEWTTIDLGNDRKGELGDPWACDWERLIPRAERSQQSSNKESGAPISPLRQLSMQDATELLASHPLGGDSPYVFTVKISMVQKGVPTTCARIYRLPTNNAELRAKWLSLMPGSRTTNIHKKAPTARGKSSFDNKNMQSYLSRRELASSLLDKERQRKPGSEKYPVVPDEIDLIGFVTTGNYNLAEGHPTAIANVMLQRCSKLEHEDVELSGSGREEHVCIIRETGQTLGRLATWEMV